MVAKLQDDIFDAFIKELSGPDGLPPKMVEGIKDAFEQQKKVKPADLELIFDPPAADDVQ